MSQEVFPLSMTNSQPEQAVIANYTSPNKLANPLEWIRTHRVATFAVSAFATISANLFAADSARGQDFVCKPDTGTMTVPMPEGMPPMEVPCAPETSAPTPPEQDQAPAQSPQSETTESASQPENYDTSNSGAESDTHDNSNEASENRSKKKKKSHGSSSSTREESVFSDEWNFPGYEMAARDITDGNGCFLATASTAFRVATGNAKINPQRVYAKSPELKAHWTPQTGVKQGNLDSILPKVAPRFDLKSYKIGPKRVKDTLNKGGQVIMVFRAGDFAGGSGHYINARKVLSNGNIKLSDANGTGKSRDTEKKSGWSLGELHDKGLDRMYAVVRKNRR